MSRVRGATAIRRKPASALMWSWMSPCVEFKTYVPPRKSSASKRMLPTVFSAMTVCARMPVSSMSPSLVTWARTIWPRTLRTVRLPVIVLMSTVEPAGTRTRKFTSPTSSRLSRRTSIVTPSPFTSGDIFVEDESIVAVTRTLFLSQASTSTLPERLMIWMRMFWRVGYSRWKRCCAKDAGASVSASRKSAAAGARRKRRARSSRERAPPASGVFLRTAVFICLRNSRFDCDPWDWRAVLPAGGAAFVGVRRRGRWRFFVCGFDRARAPLLLAELPQKLRLVAQRGVQGLLRDLVVRVLPQVVERLADRLVERVQAPVERRAHARIPTRLARLDALLPVAQAHLVRLDVGVRVSLVGDDAARLTIRANRVRTLVGRDVVDSEHGDERDGGGDGGDARRELRERKLPALVKEPPPDALARARRRRARLALDRAADAEPQRALVGRRVQLLARLARGADDGVKFLTLKLAGRARG